MRLLGRIIKDNSPVYDIAYSLGTKLTTLPQDSVVTIIEVRKDSNETFYKIEKPRGYIPKKSVMLSRDIEFFLVSKATSKKSYRNTHRVEYPLREDLMIQPDLHSAISNYTFSASGGGSATSSNIVNSYSNYSAGSAVYTASGGDLSMGTTSSGGSISSNTKNNNVLLKSMGLNVNNGTSIGSLASMVGIGTSNSTIGSLIKGATVGSLLDGSFFSSGTFGSNLISLASSLLNTLLKRLSYVVGFDIKGLLSDIYNVWGTSDTYSYTSFSSLFDQPEMDSWNEIDERMRQYFLKNGFEKSVNKYKRYLEWNTDASFDTALLTSSQNNDNSAKLEKLSEQYNDLGYDVMDDETLKLLHKRLGIDISRTSNVYNFNRFRAVVRDEILTRTVGYVFFTRPDLNINVSSSEILMADTSLLYFNMQSQHSALLAGLMSNFSSSHKFLPLLSNRVTSIDISDENLKEKEVGDTLTGWKIAYGGTLLESQTANTVTTGFVDDNQLSIYLTLKMWEEYINAVSRGICSPKETYLKTKQLDYACSIYYFLCREDGESIIFWNKYTGCFPLNLPSSSFSDSLGETKFNPKYNISWKYSFKKDYDPLSLAEFNNLTGSDFNYVALYDESTLRSTPSMAGSPFVDTNTSGKLYKLRFREPDDSL